MAKTTWNSERFFNAIRTLNDLIDEISDRLEGHDLVNLVDELEAGTKDLSFKNRDFIEFIVAHVTPDGPERKAAQKIDDVGTSALRIKTDLTNLIERVVKIRREARKTATAAGITVPGAADAEEER